MADTGPAIVLACKNYLVDSSTRGLYNLGPTVHFRFNELTELLGRGVGGNRTQTSQLLFDCGLGKRITHSLVHFLNDLVRSSFGSDHAKPGRHVEVGEARFLH